MARGRVIVVAAVVALMAPAGALGRSPRLPRTPVPRGFVGMNINGPLFTPQGGVAIPGQFRLMRSSGTQSVRVEFRWSDAQPYASWSAVPAGQRGAFVNGAGGIPTSFAATDQVVALAVARGMSVLPVVLNAPSWDTPPPSPLLLVQPPTDYRPYAEYLTTLVQRYGPGGSFWGQHPTLPRQPIRMWEIWNEPELFFFWPAQPWPSTYVELLRSARSAIKGADRGARIVLGGLTNYSWRDLAKIYRVGGARRLFDVVEVHPYTTHPAGVVRILAYVRTTMDKAGDRRKPMIAGETGWMSSLHRTPRKYAFETTQAGQANKVRALLPLLAANRRALGLISFYWYTWMGNEYSGADPFNFSGLESFHNGQVGAKPALAAFAQLARAIER